MDLNEVEDVVKTAAQEVGGLSISSERDSGYIKFSLDVRSSGDREPDVRDQQVRIWTSGAEAFFIDAPGGFGYQDFDHEPQGQVAILRLLVDLASEYLRGHFEEKEEQRSFGRRRRHLEIATGGEVYRLYQK